MQFEFEQIKLQEFCLIVQLIMMIRDFPAGNYMFKVNNRIIRRKCEICSKLTIKTPERRQWRLSGVFIVNFEHISHSPCSSVSIVNSEQVNAGCISAAIVSSFDSFAYRRNLLY